MLGRKRGAKGSEHLVGVAERVRAYADAPHSDNGNGSKPDDLESRELNGLVERAETFLAVMPPRQRRETVEHLVAPNDPERGRHAIDVLIERAVAFEDERGCLRLHR
jgi:hypothetical protein